MICNCRWPAVICNIDSHINSFRFLSISGHFLTTHENQNQSIRSRTISCNRVIFFRLSQKEKLLEPIEKNPYFVIVTSEMVPATMSIALFRWSQRFIYFFFIFSFVIGNAKPTCLDCVNNNIYSGIYLLQNLHGTLWHWRSLRYANLFRFWFDKRQQYVIFKHD